MSRTGKPEKRRSTAHIGKTETRQYTTSDLEVRASGKGDTITIAGSPIIYNSPYDVTDRLGTFKETMHRGVVTDLIKGGKLRTALLVNHDSKSLPLARVPHTLQLLDTARALTFEAQLDGRMQLARELSYSIERKDISAMSIGFLVATPDGDRWNSDETERDVFRFCDLLDVSAVTWPASPTTSIEVAQRLAHLTDLANQSPTVPTTALALELDLMRMRGEQRARERARREHTERAFAILRAVAQEARLKAAFDLDNCLDAHPKEFQSVMSALRAAGQVVVVLTGTKGVGGTTKPEKLGYLGSLGFGNGTFDDLVVLPDSGKGDLPGEKAKWCIANAIDVLVDNDQQNCAAAAGAGVPLCLSPYGAGEPTGAMARIAGSLAELRSFETQHYSAIIRAKYTQAEVDALGKQGHALKDDVGEHFSYPVHDLQDLKRAIKSIGRGGNDHNKIRLYVIGRARVMGQMALIPDSWNLADGSLKAK